VTILFIGCVEFSQKSLDAVLAIRDVSVVGIITRTSSKFNSDFFSLEKTALERDIPCLVLQDNNQDVMYDWINQIQPDVIYCFGWSYLLNNRIISLPKKGTVGFHPAELPFNRGRHPLIWALALGLEKTASTFFMMNEGADSGDIISQVPIEIDSEDDARSLYDKVVSVALQQVRDITSRFILNTVHGIPQDHSLANYWRKRSRIDGVIDWRMSFENIYNLVRSLRRPYPGATCSYKGQEYIVWLVRKSHSNTDVLNIEPGKVVFIRNQAIVIKCGDGLVELVEHELSEIPQVGEYL
jgi:methionyl-tRNA formyltransferase